MTSYTITITPDDNSATTTTLRLDTAGGNVTLTDLHLHAGNGLSTGALPAIDYGLLMEAIRPSAPTPIIDAPSAAAEIEAAPAPAPADTPSTSEKPAERPAKASGAKATTTRAAKATKTTATKATRTRRAPSKKAAAAEAEPAATPRSRRASASTRAGAQSGNGAAMAKKTAKAAPAKKSTTRSAPSSERAYRRMPDDFATVYEQAGSAAGVADHYGVPRHTAHGWIRRLRGQESAAATR